MSNNEIKEPREFLAIKNRYIMKDLIGKGSFKEVYSCEDLEKEHANIAIKISSDIESFT